MKIQYGNKITQKADPLQAITLERLYRGIRHSKQPFIDQIERLRTIAGIDQRQYAELKKRLPYFVCGIFHPAIRQKTHFASIECFMIDLDHLGRYDLNMEMLVDSLRNSPQVALLFCSPSGDGLKIMFKLKEPCKDEALFSAFYQLFATRFAVQYGVQDAVDYNTKDVTRACFLSHDPNAYYNENAVPVEIQHFINPLDFDRVEQEIKQADRIIKDIQKEHIQPTVDKDILAQVRQTLNPKAKKRPPKEVVKPPQLNHFLEYLRAHIEQYNLQLLEDTPINYARKLKIGVGNVWCEINLFFGKRGFKIVQTPKTGSNIELAELAQAAIQEMIFDFEDLKNNQS